MQEYCQCAIQKVHLLDFHFFFYKSAAVHHKAAPKKRMWRVVLHTEYTTSVSYSYQFSVHHKESVGSDTRHAKMSFTQDEMGDKKIDVRGPLCFHSCLQRSDISCSLLLYTISAAIGFYIMHTQRKNSYFPNTPPTFACGVYQCSMFRSLPNNSSNIVEIVSPSDGRPLLCIRAQAHYECLTTIQKCFASALPSQQKIFVPWPVVPRKGSWQLIPPKIMSTKIYATHIFPFIVPFLAREKRLRWCNAMVAQPWYSIVIEGEAKLYKSYKDGW